MELTFEDFRKRAQDSELSKWEKIGFPDSYRNGNEKLIFEDIYQKCELENQETIKILDIGCGCSDLVNHLINYCSESNRQLFLIDSQEMLENISTNELNVMKVPGNFPEIDFIKDKSNYFDCIIIYSVIQYPFLEQSMFKFLHKCIDLIKPGGRILIGDIPNYSARNRFLNSAEGKSFIKDQNLTNSKLQFSHSNDERIDDSIVMAILARFRNFGCETYILPQRKGLPFANRREDILIIKR